MKKTLLSLLLIGSLLAVTACTDVASNNQLANGDVAGGAGPDAEAAATPSPAQTNEAPAEKPAAATPEALVGELYDRHDNESSPFFQDENRELVDRYFVKTLADMIWQDAVEADEEIGALDFDPLYNAQDTEIADFQLGRADIKGDKATVNAVFDNFGESQTVKYLLTKENGVWKIEDIDYGDTTLVKIYGENLKEPNK